MEKIIAGKNIAVNEEGYLTDFSQWDKNVAIEIAKENNVALTPRHWEVITYLQGEHKNQVPLSQFVKLVKAMWLTLKSFMNCFLMDH